MRLLCYKLNDLKSKNTCLGHAEGFVEDKEVVNLNYREAGLKENQAQLTNRAVKGTMESRMPTIWGCKVADWEDIQALGGNCRFMKKPLQARS